jgi:transposase-like protein
MIATELIKVKEKWVSLYRAVDSHGDTLYFMLSEHHDEDAATNNVLGKMSTFKTVHDLIL